MARKSCEYSQNLREIMEYITAEGGTQEEIEQCLELHQDLLRQGSGRIATASDGIKGKGDVQSGRERHSHGGNRPR